MGYYWLSYLAVLLTYWGVDHPAVLGGLVLFIALRRWIPDPWVLVRTFGRIRALREQIAANPANVTARRDLARIYLERLRPRAAVRLLDEALERDAKNAELLYLRGLALHRAGAHEAALEPLVRAVELDPRVGFGEAYLVAGDALSALERYEEAADAYERFLETNSSSVQGWVKLARVHLRARQKSEAERALDEAFTTWRQIPGYRRRKELRWYLHAHLARFLS